MAMFINIHRPVIYKEISQMEIKLILVNMTEVIVEY